jgi:hypothetical protein
MKTTDLLPYYFGWPHAAVAGAGVLATLIAILWCLDATFDGPGKSDEVTAEERAASKLNKMRAWLSLLAVLTVTILAVWSSQHTPQSVQDDLRADLKDTYGLTVSDKQISKYTSKFTGLDSPPRTGFEVETEDANGERLEAVLVVRAGHIHALKASTGIELATTGGDR